MTVAAPTAALWRLDRVSLGRRVVDVSLTIEQGVTAVVGASGAGKTSLLNMLVGFERPTRGDLERSAGDADGLPLYWVPPDDGLWPHLSVSEHLRAVNAADPGPLLEAFDLDGRADARPEAMSAGQRARLAVARAVAANPGVLVMDEPMAHVDRLTARRCWDAVERWRSLRGASIVFASHNTDHVLRLADRVICLDAGRVLYAGPVDDLYRDPPSLQLAHVLGEANWLTPADAHRLLGVGADRPRCYRPEQIAVEPGERLTLDATRDLGPVGESEVRDADGGRYRVVHRPTGGRLASGAAVTLRLVLSLLLALLLTACGSGESPTLDVQHVRHWPMPPDGARIPAPRSITIGPHDEVLVLDNAGRVLLFDADGQLQRQWSMPSNEDGNPEGAAFLADGRIAVADTHYHRVLLFDREGNVVGSFGEFDPQGGPGSFTFPVDIVQLDSGELLVAEYGGNDRVQRFTVDGKFISQFGSVGTGPGQFQRAAGMVLHAGNVFVADATNGCVHVFTQDGQLLGELGGAEPLRFDFPYDLDLAPDGTLLVVEWGAGRFSRVTTDGRLLGRYGSPGSSTGQFRTPWGIGVDSQMRVRVADTENRRIVDLQL